MFTVTNTSQNQDEHFLQNSTFLNVTHNLVSLTGRPSTFSMIDHARCFLQSEIKWWIKKDSQCSLVLAAALAATRAKTNARKHRLAVILVAPAISTGPLALPPPPPPLHLRHLQQLGGGHLGARQDEGGHRAEAGLKLVRRVLLEATEAAADRTSIRPLLLLLLPLLLLLQVISIISSLDTSKSTSTTKPYLAHLTGRFIHRGIKLISVSDESYPRRRSFIPSPFHPSKIVGTVERTQTVR